MYVYFNNNNYIYDCNTNNVNTYSNNNQHICMICLDDEYNGEYNDIHDNDHNNNNKRFVTSCGHHYHYGCLYNWCVQNNSCPTCRLTNVLSLHNQNNVCVDRSEIPNNPYILSDFINRNWQIYLHSNNETWGGFPNNIRRQNYLHSNNENRRGFPNTISI